MSHDGEQPTVGCAALHLPYMPDPPECQLVLVPMLCVGTRYILPAVTKAVYYFNSPASL